MVGLSPAPGQVFVAVGVLCVDVNLDGLDGWERRTIEGYRWWTAEELEADGGTATSGLPDLMHSAIQRVQAP